MWIQDNHNSLWPLSDMCRPDSSDSTVSSEVATSQLSNELDTVDQAELLAIARHGSQQGPGKRHHQGIDAFHEQHPRAHEACFVTAESFEQGLPELVAG